MPTVRGMEVEKERGRWGCLFVVIVREGKAASTNLPHTDKFKPWVIAREEGKSGGTAPCLGVGVAWKCAFALQVGRQVHIFNVEVFEQSPRGKIL